MVFSAYVRYFSLPHYALWLLLSSLLFISSLQASYANDLVVIDPQTIKAEAWLVLDADSGQILGQVNAHARRAPASLTKMMVAYLSLEQIKAGKLALADVLTVPEAVNHIESDESKMYLHAGEQIKVSDLLTGLIVTSANDAAVTLSTHIAGDMPHFIEKMNQAASALGMHDTHFANVSGITAEDHYTSAYDMAILSKAIIQQYPEYTSFSKIQHFSYGAFSEAATNRLLKVDPTVDGMKTGYTKAAGYNIVITAKRPQSGIDQYRRIFVVVLGSTSLSERARTAGVLLNAAYEQTQNVQLLKLNQPLAQVKLWQAEKNNLMIRAPYSVFVTVANKPLANTTASTISNNLQLANTVPAQMGVNELATRSQVSLPLKQRYVLKLDQNAYTAPLISHQRLGQLKIEYGTQPAIAIDLFNTETIEPAGFFKRNWDRFTFFFNQLFNINSSIEQLI